MTPGSRTVELRSITQVPVSWETETKNNQASQERLTNERRDPAPQRDEEPERETEMHNGTWTQKQKRTDKEQTLPKIKLPRFSPNPKATQTQDLTTNFFITIK
jgi:hypothetical protein